MNRTNIPTRFLPLGAGHGAPLPYDALVEYVKSERNQYVDTRIPAVTPFLFHAKFSLNAGGRTNDSLFGVFRDNNRLWLLQTILANGKNRISIRCTAPNTSGGSNVVDLVEDQIASVSARFGSNGWFELNGGSRVSVTGFEVSLPNYDLFLLGRNGVNYPIGAKLYEASISDATGTLLRDFAPCRVGTAGALYDRVSGTLYYSATSTALVPGPDLP